MLLKSVELVVEQDLDLGFYLEFAKLNDLTIPHLLFLVDLNYPDVHLVLLSRDYLPGFILYRMASIANDDVCIALAKSTKAKAVLHLLSSHKNKAVVREVKGNGCVSSATLKKIG